ncbi:MAG: VWA domain-containing protein, partial [Thermoanaerobaculia bacterium]|nr:VWA domain-containing protein [Thermoanaerobaculia bacterium]
LVDQSGSMKERIEEARLAALGFLSEVMRARDLGFIGGFSWGTNDLSPLVSDVASLRLQASRMDEAEGATALYDAIVSGLYRFRGVEGRKALIIVTDGEDTASRISRDEMIRYMRASRVPVYFIGIGLTRIDFITTSKLRRLSEETGGAAHFVGGVDELDKAYASIEAELRSQYLLGYYTGAVGDEESYRSVEVDVPGREVTVRSIRGYIP